jgi:hypothetical protein
MTTAQIPALTTTPPPQDVARVVNSLARQFNRQDVIPTIYAADTGTGAAYSIGPIPGIQFWQVGQVFVFNAANANTTTAPTFTCNGLTAGAITKLGSAALAVGDIAANAFVKLVCMTTTPTFQLLSPVTTPITLSGATTFLANDVALNNTANFFAGPNTGSIGASGQVWLIMATATMSDSGAAAVMEATIFDGTTRYAGSLATTFAATAKISISVSVVVTLTAATTFTLSVKDQSATTGTLLTTGGGASTNKATSITAVRLA